VTAIILASVISAFGAILSGVALFWVKVMYQSRQSQGERLGALEDWRKFEEGRRAGLAEAKHHERDGGK